MIRSAVRIVWALGAAGALVVVAAGCYSVDPTEQGFTIYILNDTPNKITLGYCSNDDCTSFYDSWDVKARARTDTAISDRGVFDHYAVSTAAGRRLGCLPLRFTRAYENVVVRVSQVVRCPGDKPLVVKHGEHIDQDNFP